MERDEWDDLCPCVDCGATIAPGPDRAFAISDDEFLCWQCAIRRGGVFDEEDDAWIIAPNVADEPDERRPHA